MMVVVVLFRLGVFRKKLFGRMKSSKCRSDRDGGVLHNNGGAEGGSVFIVSVMSFVRGCVSSVRYSFMFGFNKYSEVINIEMFADADSIYLSFSCVIFPRENILVKVFAFFIRSINQLPFLFCFPIISIGRRKPLLLSRLLDFLFF